MVNGEIGVPGQNVNPIVQKEDPDYATILPQLIQEEIALEKEKTLKNVLQITAKLMEIGDNGTVGQNVNPIVRKEGPGHVTILSQ